VEEQEAQVKELLGSDYETYLTFKSRQELKVKKAKAREIATAAVSEGGEYATQWAKLNSQLDAIWLKVMTAANAQVGIVEDQPKEEE